MDTVILAMLALLATLCLTSAISLAVSTERKGDDMWYLEPDEADEDFDPSRPGLIILTSLITSFILYGYLIPISLYVSLEIVKVLQVMIMIAHVVTLGGGDEKGGEGKTLFLYRSYWLIVCTFVVVVVFPSPFCSPPGIGLGYYQGSEHV